MSPPSTPPEPAAAAPGDAVPPPEKEPRWWTPLAAALDRWLEPRWRALLTCAVLAAVASYIGRTREFETALLNGIEIVSARLGEYLPIRSLPLDKSFSAANALFAFWYLPLLFRIGPARCAIWILALTLLYVTQQTSAALSTTPMWAWGLVFGMTGLVIYGRRSRPWMSFIGACLMWFISPRMAAYWNNLMGGAHPMDADTPLLAHVLYGLTFPVAISVYAAVMLYGTAPLPRKEGAR